MATFAPSVLIDGQTVTPPGWAWVLAFALRGVPWAVAEADRPEFRRMVRDHFRDAERAADMEEAAELERQAAALKAKWE